MPNNCTKWRDSKESDKVVPATGGEKSDYVQTLLKLKTLLANTLHLSRVLLNLSEHSNEAI